MIPKNTGYLLSQWLSSIPKGHTVDTVLDRFVIAVLILSARIILQFRLAIFFDREPREKETLTLAGICIGFAFAIAFAISIVTALG